MKAIKIDSHTKTIEEVQIEGLPGMQAVVEGYITVALELDDENTLFVDDEGLLKDPKDFFLWRSETESKKTRGFAGNGLIVGHNDEGDSTNVSFSLEKVKILCAFVDGFTFSCLVEEGYVA